MGTPRRILELFSKASIEKRTKIFAEHHRAMVLCELVEANLATPTPEAYKGCLAKLQEALEHGSN